MVLGDRLHWGAHAITCPFPEDWDGEINAWVKIKSEVKSVLQKGRFELWIFMGCVYFFTLSIYDSYVVIHRMNVFEAKLFYLNVDRDI